MMDYEYAKAYMAERLQMAERRRLLTSAGVEDGRPSLFTRLNETIQARSPRSNAVGPTMSIAAVDCLELECCPA